MSDFRNKAVATAAPSRRNLLVALVSGLFLIGAAQYAPAAHAAGHGGGHGGGGHSFHGGGGFHGGPHFGGGPRWRGGYWGGAIIGGAIVGSAFANPYYYGPGYNSYNGYYDPGYAAPGYYPPAAYGPPDTYVESADGGAPALPYDGAAAPNYQGAYQGAAPPPPPQAQQQLSMQQRVQRLDQMCQQGVFTAQECSQRRRELLNQM